jgi:hypothetical protein
VQQPDRPIRILRIGPGYWPGEEPSRPLKLSDDWVSRFGSKITQDSLSRSFGRMQDYRPVLEEITRSLNEIAQGRNQQGATLMERFGKGMWRTNVPRYGQVLFSVNDRGEIDEIRLLKATDAKGKLAAQQTMRVNANSRKNRSAYSRELRERYAPPSDNSSSVPAQTPRRPTVRLTLANFPQRRLTASADLQQAAHDGNRMAQVAARFGDYTLAQVVDGTIAGVDAQIAAARQQGRSLAVHRVAGKHEMFRIDIPHSASAPSPFGQALSVVVRLNTDGQMVDLERSDRDLASAVRLIRNRASQWKAKEEAAEGKAGPSGSTGQ